MSAEIPLIETQDGDVRDSSDYQNSSESVTKNCTEETKFNEQGISSEPMVPCLNDDDTSDETDEEGTEQFLSLLNKAENRNKRKEKRKEMFKGMKFGGPRLDWRTPELGETNDDTSDTDDEDDNQETKRFLNLISQGRKKSTGSKGMVNLSYSSGKLQIKNLTPGMKITQSTDGMSMKSSREELILRRKQELHESKRNPLVDSPSRSKRKFGERMTFTEAKVDDFDDMKDYVDFLNSKLKNVSIKMIR